MAYPELVKYIKDARASGATDEQIKSALVGVGWKTQDIDQSFSQLNEETVKPAEPKKLEFKEIKENKETLTPQKILEITNDKPKTTEQPFSEPVKQRPAVFTSNKQEDSGSSKGSTIQLNNSTFTKTPVTNNSTKNKTTENNQNSTLNSSQANSKDKPHLISAWLGYLTSPVKTFAREKYYSTFERTIESMLLSWGMFVTIIVVFSLVGYFSSNSMFLNLPNIISNNVFTITPLSVAFILFDTFIFADILIFSTLIVHVLTKLVGGKGEYSEFVHLVSIGSASVVLYLVGASVIQTITMIAGYVLMGSTGLMYGFAAGFLVNGVIALVLSARVYSEVFFDSILKGIATSIILAIIQVTLIFISIYLVLNQNAKIMGMIANSFGPMGFVVIFAGAVLIYQPVMLVISMIQHSLFVSEELNFVRSSLLIFLFFILSSLVYYVLAYMFFSNPTAFASLPLIP